MTGRKNVLDTYTLFNNVDISANRTSPFTNDLYLDNIGITTYWTGTSPVGALIVEGTNDDATSTIVAPVWTAFDFGSTISISGNTGGDLININQCPFKYVRVRYAFSSGTGNLTAKIVAKMV